MRGDLEEQRFPNRITEGRSTHVHRVLGVEAKMKERIQTYGRKTREVGFHRDLEKERNNISDKIYKSLRRAQNQGTTRDTDGSFSRPEGGRDNLERVAMPKFGGRSKG